jgi:predicted HAD superfamily hydrolase
MIVHDLSLIDSFDLESAVALSFDIFDTLIARAIDPPEYIKRLTAKYAVRELHLPISPQLFFNLRMQVESNICGLSKKEGRDGECCIADVYSAMCRELGILDDNVTKLLECELEVEKAYGLILPDIKPFISNLASKHNLIAVSDTYLPAWMLKELLQYHGLDGYFSNVHASCEYGLSKGSGRLFIKVLEQENLKPNELLHIGDNFLGDYFSPRSLGIRSILLRDRKNLRRKASLTALTKLETRFPSRHSAAFVERLTSDREPITDSTADQFYKWGRVVVGPLLSNYVHLLCVELASSGNDAVYFIAREGYLLKKLYKLFCDEFFEYSLPKAHYLCISRYTAFLASLHGGMEDREIDIALSEYRVTPAAALARFGISDQHEIKHLIDTDIFLNNTEAPKDELAGLLHRVLEDDSCGALVRERSNEMRAVLGNYLEREGFFTSERVALADVGWFGGIQDGLEKAFSDRQDKPRIHGYYLALEGSKLYSGVDKTGLVHDFRNPTPDGTSLGFFKLAFEFSCRAPHGTTTGYEESAGGRMVPRFKRDDREKASNPAVAALQRGVLDCARQYVQLMKVERVDPCGLRGALLANYDKQVSFPDPALAEAFRTVINTEDFGSDKVKDIAASFTIRDFFRPRIALERVIETPWREAALMKLPLPGVLLLFCLLKRLLAWRKMWVHLRGAGDGMLLGLAGVLGQLCYRYRIIMAQRFPFHVLRCLYIAAEMKRNLLISLLIFVLRPLTPSGAVSVIMFLARTKAFIVSSGRPIRRIRGEPLA